jgi:gluconate 2-dehydrogenase subunit 3-like protein
MPPSLRSALRALATSFIPETAGASAAEWAELEARVERALADRPATMRRQLGLFLLLLDATARLRHLTRFSALDSPRRTALLESLARSRLLLIRRGIWGLRTLIMLGWYTQPSVIGAIGYRADPAGWDARR